MLEAFVGMGFEQRDAQGMIDHAAPHVGSDATLDAAMRAALQRGRLAERPRLAA